MRIASTKSANYKKLESIELENDGLNTVRSKKPKKQSNFGFIKIQVIDTGIGISEEQSLKLFHQFSMGDAKISTKLGGTGLGLWASKKIIQEFGGDIQIESKLGCGCNVIVVFPAKIPEIIQNDEINESSIKYDTDKNKWSIFLLAENEMNRAVLEVALKALGCNCREFTNPQQACHQALMEPPRTRILILEGGVLYLSSIIKDLQLLYTHEPKIQKIPTFVILDDYQALINEFPFLNQPPYFIHRVPVYLDTLSFHVNALINPSRKKLITGEPAKILLVSSDPITNTILRNRIKVPLVEFVEKRSLEDAYAFYIVNQKDTKAIIYDADLKMDSEWISSIRNYELLNVLSEAQIFVIGSGDMKILSGQFSRLGILSFMEKPLKVKELNSKIASLYQT